jgi:hypothetical protein
VDGRNTSNGTTAQTHNLYKIFISISIPWPNKRAIEILFSF